MKNILYFFTTVLCSCGYASQDINRPIISKNWYYASMQYRKAVRESDDALKTVKAAFEEYDKAKFALLAAQFFAHPYIVGTFGCPEKPEEVECAQKRYNMAYETWQSKREKVVESEQNEFSRRRKLDALTPHWYSFLRL
jgi:hypothetical protein